APVADAGDAVERALNAGAVVVAEFTDVRDDVLDVALGHLPFAEHDLPAGEPRLRQAPQVHDHFQQLVSVRTVADRLADVRRQRVQQQVQVIRDRSTQVQVILQLRFLPRPARPSAESAAAWCGAPARCTALRPGTLPPPGVAPAVRSWSGPAPGGARCPGRPGTPGLRPGGQAPPPPCPRTASSRTGRPAPAWTPAPTPSSRGRVR